MPKITYIEASGNRKTIEVEKGLSVMEGAVQNNIPGIDADCGGSMACATCHVYVKEEWFNKLPKAEDAEQDMIDMAFEPKKNSRLSCQLIVSDELDGIVVTTPSKQISVSKLLASKNTVINTPSPGGIVPPVKEKPTTVTPCSPSAADTVNVEVLSVVNTFK